jgi:uncharacterized protein YegP (UPF0339 family)
VLIARNGEPVGRSEMYSSNSARNNGIASVQTNGLAARVDDLAARVDDLAARVDDLTD